MSKSSEAVIRWRKLTKQRIIASMGGQCCCCGYNRCDAALELHHLNPAEKEMSIAELRASPRAWATICAELRKCVLVCSICHREAHHGMREIPADAIRFDEAYADYKTVERSMRLGTCPVCASSMRAGNVTCSLVCAGVKKNRADWARFDLAEMVKTKSLVEIGKIVGVSDKAVSKRLKKLGLK